MLAALLVPLFCANDPGPPPCDPELQTWIYTCVLDTFSLKEVPWKISQGYDHLLCATGLIPSKACQGTASFWCFPFLPAWSLNLITQSYCHLWIWSDFPPWSDTSWMNLEHHRAWERWRSPVRPELSISGRPLCDLWVLPALSFWTAFVSEDFVISVSDHKLGFSTSATFPMWLAKGWVFCFYL